ncbi:MAG: hypothetical protein KGJ49_14185 [Alphaproteobacteria bacterium]|nr:hypothetical protein [Alphaproteobacteria bacterium]
MKFWTVQCSFASYDAKTVVVEAETLEQALDRAIEEANNGDGWSSLDVCGDTFVDAVAEGNDVDPWKDFASSLAVPARFTERGEPPLVTVTVSGGVVQDVSIDGGKVRVHVRDYDTDGADDPSIQTDAAGERFTLADWSNDLPPDGPAEAARDEARETTPTQE